MAQNIAKNYWIVMEKKMIERFAGPEKREQRIEAFCEQFLVHNDKDIASFFADNCEVLALKKGDTLITQDGTDNDIYFIALGSVDVLVNDRVVAERKKGIHVGEMALLDNTSKRSATVIAREETIVFKVSETTFSTRANKTSPNLWRRMAVEVSNRLRERSKFLKMPNPRPLVFVGSSSENMKKAEQIQEVIKSHGFDVKCWADSDLFRLTESTLDNLISIFKGYDFAILYLGAEDTTEYRGDEYKTPRDNVVFELGMSIGFLEKNRTFFIRENNPKIKLPSDLNGITYLPATLTTGGDLSDDTKNLITQKIVHLIVSQGPK